MARLRIDNIDDINDRNDFVNDFVKDIANDFVNDIANDFVNTKGRKTSSGGGGVP